MPGSLYAYHSHLAQRLLVVSMSPLILCTGVRLTAVECTEYITDFLVYCTPIFTLVSFAAVVDRSLGCWDNYMYISDGLPIAGYSALSTLHVSWFLTQLAGQLRAFRRC